MSDPPNRLLLNVIIEPGLRTFRLNLAGHPRIQAQLTNDGLNWHLVLFHRLFELFCQHQLWREPLPGEGELALLVPIAAVCKPSGSTGRDIHLIILENQTRVVIRKDRRHPNTHPALFTLLQLQLQDTGQWWTG